MEMIKKGLDLVQEAVKSSDSKDYLGALAKAECTDNSVCQDDMDLIMSKVDANPVASERMVEVRRQAQLMFA